MLLDPGAWQINHQEVLTRWGVSSQLIVASPAERANGWLIRNAAVSQTTAGGTGGPAPPSIPQSVTRVNEGERDYADGEILEEGGDEPT
jgi:hypothetical protein